MTLTFTTTRGAGTVHGIKALVYGGAGAGKTLLCGTAPGPLILSAEAGLLTLRDRDVPVIQINAHQDMWDALTWVQTNGVKYGIKTVCLDSISEIVERCLAAAKARSKDPRMAYGDMAEESIKLVKAFRDLPGFHVLVTAKQEIGKDPVTGVPKAAPTAPGQQVGPALPYLFDLVMHAFTDKTPSGEPYWALRTKGSFNAEAKDRSGRLDELEYPDFTNIINKIHA